MAISRNDHIKEGQGRRLQTKSSEERNGKKEREMIFSKQFKI